MNYPVDQVAILTKQLPWYLEFVLYTLPHNWIKVKFVDVLRIIGTTFNIKYKARN